MNKYKLKKTKDQKNRYYMEEHSTTHDFVIRISHEPDYASGYSGRFSGNIEDREKIIRSFTMSTYPRNVDFWKL